MQFSRKIAPSRACRRQLRCCANLRARWCFDARYGCKQEATALLQEWVRTVGSSAGVSAANTRLSSGLLGVPESRLEMEVTFPSMAEFEAFLGAIPFQEHKAWTQRIASMVVDGSPVWEVHRSVPLGVTPSADAAAVRLPVPPRGVAAQPQQLVLTDKISPADVAAWEQAKQQGSGPAAPSTPPSSTPPAGSEADAPVQRDWKGDPIKFNPGDKLPFKFL